MDNCVLLFRFILKSFEDNNILIICRDIWRTLLPFVTRVQVNCSGASEPVKAGVQVAKKSRLSLLEELQKSTCSQNMSLLNQPLLSENETSDESCSDSQETVAMDEPEAVVMDEPEAVVQSSCSNGLLITPESGVFCYQASYSSEMVCCS